MNTVARGSSRQASAASNRGQKIIGVPLSSEVWHATNSPWVWKMGSMWRSTSPARNPQASCSTCAFENRLAWVEHRALGLAGGTRGVEERGEVVGLPLDRVEALGHRAARLDQGAVFVRAESQRLTDAVTLAQPGDRVQELRPRHHHPGLGIAEEVVQLPLRIRGVEREIDGARAQAREVEDERLRRLLHLHRNAVAGFDAPLAHQARVARRSGLDVGPGPHRAVGGFEAGGGAVGGEVRFEECVQVGVVHLTRSSILRRGTEREPEQRPCEQYTHIAYSVTDEHPVR